MVNASYACVYLSKLFSCLSKHTCTLSHTFSLSQTRTHTRTHIHMHTAEGMKALREQNIVHRDLKPGNILIMTSPRTGKMMVGERVGLNGVHRIP